MTSAATPPIEPLQRHADEAVAGATGRTLALWAAGPDLLLGPAVTSVDHYGVGPLAASYDSITSLGQLGTAPDLTGLLVSLREVMSLDTVLFFCEPTIATDRPTPTPPHDVTTTLWTRGFTVFLCHRFQSRRGLRTHDYCWGRARLRPPGVPCRR